MLTIWQMPPVKKIGKLAKVSRMMKKYAKSENQKK